MTFYPSLFDGLVCKVFEPPSWDGRKITKINKPKWYIMEMNNNLFYPSKGFLADVKKNSMKEITYDFLMVVV